MRAPDPHSEIRLSKRPGTIIKKYGRIAKEFENDECKLREKEESESRELFAESQLFVEGVTGGCKLAGGNKEAG